MPRLRNTVLSLALRPLFLGGRVMSVPELRFPEFDGEWEEKKLGYLSEITKLTGFEYTSFWNIDPNGEIIALRGFNIGQNKIFLEETERINKELSQKLIRSKLFKWDIVFPCTGTIGNAALINEDDEYHINQNIAKISCKKNIIPSFLVQFLITDIVKRQIIKYNTSGGQPVVLIGTLRLFKIQLTSLKEQEKIAYFLSTVDEKIEKLEKKQVLWEAYKKGMMQKIFSQELRFKDENGEEYPDWFYLNFNEIFKSISTRKYQIKSSEISQNGNFIVIDQGKNLIAGFSDDSSKVFADIPVIVYGDHTTIVKYAENKFIIGADGTKLLKSKINSSLKYLYYSLDFFNVQAEGYKRHFSILKNSNLPIPSIQEQKKIYDFLSNIDIKLEKIKKELQINQYYKKGLLQKLFC